MTSFKNDLNKGKSNELYFKRVIERLKGKPPKDATFDQQKKGIDYVVDSTKIEVKSYKAEYNHFCIEIITGNKTGWLFSCKSDFIAFTDAKKKIIHLLRLKDARVHIIKNFKKYKERTNEKTILNGISYASTFLIVPIIELEQFLTTLANK